MVKKDKLRREPEEIQDEGEGLSSLPSKAEQLIEKKHRQIAAPVGF